MPELLDIVNPRVLRRRDQEATWDLHKARTVGFMRGKCNSMQGSNFSAGMVVMPIGQASPVHSNVAQHIIFQLEGEVEFRFEDDRYALAVYDMLFIPAGVKYAYFNIGLTSAIFLSIISAVDEWPPDVIYFD